jgi:hypothetical protein
LEARAGGGLGGAAWSGVGASSAGSAGSNGSAGGAASLTQLRTAGNLTTMGSVGVDDEGEVLNAEHVRWLLALAPRLRPVLLRLCSDGLGVGECSAAVGGGAGAGAGAGAGGSSVDSRGDSGVMSSSSFVGSHKVSSPQQKSAAKTAPAASTPAMSAKHSRVGASLPGRVPGPVRRVWCALGEAAEFCQRCHRAERARAAASSIPDGGVRSQGPGSLSNGNGGGGGGAGGGGCA